MSLRISIVIPNFNSGPVLERAIRSLGALSGGLLREIGSVALPPGIRRTTLYRTMVEVTLRFLIEEVGQVKGIYPYQDQLAQNFILEGLWGDRVNGRGR